MNARERPTALGIRLHYPHPTETDEGYSVGGALCISMGGDKTDECERRPTRGRLAYRLGEANPSLSWEPAIYYAGQIENAETQGDIEGAWARLDEALRNHPGLSIPRFAHAPSAACWKATAPTVPRDAPSAACWRATAPTVPHGARSAMAWTATISSPAARSAPNAGLRTALTATSVLVTVRSAENYHTTVSVRTRTTSPSSTVLPGSK